MSNTARRESAEVLGLIVVRHSTGLTPQGRARDAAGLPTSAADEDVTEDHFEPLEGETVGELLARVGFDEGDRIEIRCKTPQEEIEPVVRALARRGLAVFEAAQLDVSDHAVNERPTARRDRHGAPIDPVRWESWPETEGRL